MKFEDIRIGDRKVYHEFISTEDVQAFSNVTGDKNPVHLDGEYARISIFGDRIIHGMIVGSLYSKLIASDFPGPGSIYLHQSLDFIKPIFHNSFLTIKFKVINIKVEKKIVEIETLCFVDKSVAVKGTAIVKCLF